MDASVWMRRILAEFLLFAVCCRTEESRMGRLVMPKAVWGGKVIAESDACAVVEGNQYFPAEAVKKEFLKPSNHTSVCPWKGTANYYHIEVNGMRNDNAAWYYAEPKPAAEEIRGKIAFWKGVRVEA
jgi:uncharacterized protein (DUF427 family)